MITRYFFSIGSSLKTTMVTSRSESNVKFLWKRFIEKFDGCPVLLKAGNRVVFDVKGMQREVNFGSYTFEDEDPYKMAITI